MASFMIVTPMLCVSTLEDPMSAVAVQDIQATEKHVQVGKTFFV